MKPLMLVGTGSGVGKSLLAAGFCRLFADKGIKTAPFKAQNMSLNGGKLTDGSEISRAQILQAEAAGITPDPRMNPIMLKPIGDAKSIMVRMGKEAGTLSAADYYKIKDENFKIAADAYDSLSSEYGIIVLEGAGSPAEINLMKDDIVNMRMAAYADAAVLLIGDISRGGVFASLKGTFDLVGDYQKYIQGFVINKFRGDRGILEPGLNMLKDMTSRTVFGVLDWFEHSLEEEDSLDSRDYRKIKSEEALRAGIISLPRNTGYALAPALGCYNNIETRNILSAWDVEGCEIFIMPESQNVMKSIAYLTHTGLADRIKIARIPLAAVGNGKEVCLSLGIDADIEIPCSENFNEPDVAENVFRIADSRFKISGNPRDDYDKQWCALANMIEANIDMNKLMELLES